MKTSFAQCEIDHARATAEEELQRRAHRALALKQEGERAELQCVTAAGKLSSAETDGVDGVDAVVVPAAVGAFVLDFTLFKPAAAYVISWAVQSPDWIYLLSGAVPLAVLSLEVAISRLLHRAVVFNRKFGCRREEVWVWAAIGLAPALFAFLVVAATEIASASVHATPASALLLWALPTLALGVHCFVLLAGWRVLAVLEWAALKLQIWRLQRRARHCDRQYRHEGETAAGVFRKYMAFTGGSQSSTAEPLFDEQTVVFLNKWFGRTVVAVADPQNT